MNLTRINLNEIPNAGCKTKCNKHDRIESTENDLCKGVTSAIDDLPIRCVGPWAVQKIYHLYQYFGIFTSGMKNKWTEINYIEICSGPGRCISRDNGIEFDGTALSIIKHDSFKHLHKALFFDFNPTIVETLNQRLLNYQATNAKVFVGDYNNPDQICLRINKEINAKSLNLVFIDPTDCSVPFYLVRHLKRTIPNMDLIINIATGTDYNRNIKDLLLNPDKFENLLLKYSRFLESHEFFHNPMNIKLAEQSINNLALRASFREQYEKKLISIGFNYFRFKRIKNYYDLLFATANEKGLDFWDKANKYTFDGQKNLF
jgi:three-Cys-motif partner protein